MCTVMCFKNMSKVKVYLSVENPLLLFFFMYERIHSKFIKYKQLGEEMLSNIRICKWSKISKKKNQME